MGKWKVVDGDKIPQEWEYVTVDALVKDHILDKPLDGNHGNIHPKGTDYTQSGIPFIMASDISNGKINFTSCKFISKQQADNLQKGFSVEGDVLLTHKASLGRVAIVSSLDTEYIMLTPQVTYYRVKNKSKLHNKYLRYYFESPMFQKHLANHGDAGSTRAYVGITAQRNLPIVLPQELEQKSIAEVLSSLDDKIDLLHRQNKTLESMAEALFRHHFIDNAQPEWKEKPLDKIAEYLNGLACQKFPVENDHEKLPVLKIKDLRAGGFSDGSDWATSKVDSKYIIDAGDIIFSWSGSLMLKIWNGEECVLNQHLFKVTSEEYPKWLIYFWTKYYMEKFISIAEDKATTMGHIKRADLSSSMTVIPGDKLLTTLDNTINPLFNKLILNNAQIHKLEELRDTLLPKLISGEVRVQYEEAS